MSTGFFISTKWCFSSERWWAWRLSYIYSTLLFSMLLCIYISRLSKVIHSVSKPLCSASPQWITSRSVMDLVHPWIHSFFWSSCSELWKKVKPHWSSPRLYLTTISAVLRSLSIFFLRSGQTGYLPRRWRAEFGPFVKAIRDKIYFFFSFLILLWLYFEYVSRLHVTCWCFGLLVICSVSEKEWSESCIFKSRAVW